MGYHDDGSYDYNHTFNYRMVTPKPSTGSFARIAPDVSFEDELLVEVRRLTEDVATLRATLLMVRQVLVSTAPRGDLILSRIIDALGTV